jgi:PTS system nitrogen regulatory IIA component
MQLRDFIAPNAILPGLRVTSKKQLFQELSARAALLSGIGEREIFDVLWQREKLGSTGVGNGIAIPHGKLAKAGRMFGLFARLESTIDFDATDGTPVDLVCVLIAPETAGADHLKALAQIARTLRDPAFTTLLRATRDEAGIYALLTGSPTSHAA